MSLTFKTDGIAFIDVPAPYFGEDVVIRVNKKTVKSYIRASHLGNNIRDRSDVSQQDLTAYLVAAELISICTIPQTGEPAFSERQIDDIVNLMPKDVFEAFSGASFSLDPIVEQKTLTAKKKKS